jgi:hypothetical protein
MTVPRAAMASSADTSNDTEDRIADIAQTLPDGMYTIESETLSLHMKFPMPGRESGNALRGYLQRWGMAMFLDEISFDHLLDVQAMFWRETSSTVFATDFNAIMSCVAAFEYRWKDVRALAEEVWTIADLLLQGRQSGQCEDCSLTATDEYVFIVHDKSNKLCNNTTCSHPREGAQKQTDRPRIITLERLFDWGTVTPASDLQIAKGKVFPFRRNGVKMDDLLWFQEMKKMLPKNPPTYCVECLEEAMVRRVEAWSISKQLAQEAYQYQQPIQRPISVNELYNRTEESEASDTTPSPRAGPGLVDGPHLDDQHDSDDQSLCDQTPNTTPEAESWPLGGLQLEGTGETPDMKRDKPVRFVPAFTDATRTGFRSAEDNIHARTKHFVKDKFDETLSARRAPSGTFTPPASPKPIHDVAPPQSTYVSPYPSLHHHPKLPATPSSNRTTPTSSIRTSIYRDPQSPEVHEKLGSKALSQDSTPDFGPGHRKFGRQIDTNTVQSVFRQSIARRLEMAKQKEMEKAGLDIRTFFTSVNKPGTSPAGKEDTTQTTQAGPSTPKRAAKEKVVYEESDFSDERWSVSPSQDEDAPTALYSPVVKGKGKSNATTSPSTPKSAKATPGPPYTPVLRKRPDTEDDDVPSGVTPEAWEDHLNRIPEKHKKICSCRQAAQTYDVQLTQCANPTCTIGWFHKECLDKSGKIKARWGTYVCETCRNDEHFAELAQKNGRTTKKLVERELALPFTAEQMAGSLRNMGGFEASRKPYGLGTTTTRLSPMAACFTPSAATATGAKRLAQLAVGSAPSLGLATSRPYFVNEAYTNAKEHAEEADEEWERAQVVGYYDVASDEWDEEMGEGDGDGDGAGTE